MVSSRLNTARFQVRPLILISESTAINIQAGRRIGERCRAPSTFIIGLVAATVVPRGAVLIGYSFAGLMRDEVLKVLRRGEPGCLASTTAWIRHRRIFNVEAVVVEAAVIGAVCQARSAAGVRRTIRGIRARG